MLILKRFGLSAGYGKSVQKTAKRLETANTTRQDRTHGKPFINPACPRQWCLMSVRRGYFLRRLIQLIPTVLLVVLVNFILIHIAPGDPASIMAGMFADPEYIENLRQAWGFNRPLHEQLVVYLSKLLHGDLGYSLRHGEPVLSIILERLPATVLLTFSSFLLAAILGIILGVSASQRPYSSVDNIVSTISIFFYSVPVFSVGILLILLFSVHLNVFPSSGMSTVAFATEALHPLARIFDILWHLLLPMMTLALVQLALYSRLTRACVLEETGKDYILTAKAKGLERRVIFYRHALRNALIPIITLLGLRMGYLFTGAMLTETVFAWPGMGRLMYTSILTRDYPLLMGIFLITSLVVLLANFATDIVYSLVDPRVQYK